MGRSTRYRDRIEFETKSVEAKGLCGLLRRELCSEFGLSRIESEVLATRSLSWMEVLVGGVLPGQVIVSAPASSCMRLVRQRRLEVRVTAVDVGTDTALCREFGLEAMQRARAVRVLHEIRRQRGWGNLAEVAAFLDLTPNALASRLCPLREAGIWLPHLRSERPKSGHLPLDAWVVRQLLRGLGTEAVRRSVAMTVGGLEFVMRHAARVWQAHLDGESVEAIAPAEGRTSEEVSALLEVIHTYRRRRTWKDWRDAYASGETTNSRFAEAQGDPLSVLQREHGMSPVVARLYVRRLRELSVRFRATSPSKSGETLFFAISADEGARAKLEEAELVPVRLTYFTDADLDVGPRGAHQNRVRDLKFRRLLRYTTEARAQGALLTLPDLSILLGMHVDAIRRLIAAHPEVLVPTRGRIKDIGRGVTHRRQIVELYLQMYTETEIVDRTGHCYGSVESYLREFSRVATLADRGMNAVMIRRVTNRSMALVEAYLELYRQYERPEYLFRLAHLRQVFAAEDVVAGGGEKNGSSPTRRDRG